MIVSVLIFSIVKLYLILNIYQQSHYQVKSYLKHFLLNFIFYNLFPILVLIVGILNSHLVIKVISSIYLILFSIFYLISRVHLKFTKRIIRLIFLSCFCMALEMIPYVGIFLIFFIEFTIIPILFIDKLVSHLFNKPYIIRAKKRLNNYKGNIIGITGSFGKTSTKNLLVQTLNVYKNSSIGTPKSYNTPLGIATFINSLNELDFYDNLVLEFGASHKNDIKYLKTIAKVDVAFITGIGFMHVESFGNIDTIIHEKMSMLKGCKIAVLNYDNEYIRNYKIEEDCTILSYGFEHGDYRAINVVNQEFDFYYKDTFIEHFNTNLVGRHQILNLIGVLAYVHHLDYRNYERLKRALLCFKIEKNRLEVKKISDRVILDDSFNSNYLGFIEALNILRNHNGKKILITPGMVELGKYKKELMAGLIEYIVASSDIVILTGYYNSKYLYKELSKYNLELYLVRNFLEAYSLYLMISKKSKGSMLLIENDLPDLYRIGII